MIKTRNILLTVGLVFALNIFGVSQNSDSVQIRSAIENSYIHGLINGKDYAEAKRGIHHDFTLLGHQGDSLTEKSIDQWIAQRKKRPDLAEVGYKICFIDIDGDAAVSKIEMFRGSIRAVDYLFLYKFHSGWKIVSAIDEVKTVSKK